MIIYYINKEKSSQSFLPIKLKPRIGGKMATFPIKVEKPEMKIMGLNILPMMMGVNKMMPEGMRKKSVVKKVSTY